MQWQNNSYILYGIKTHGCVSAAKKAVWLTSVLFTGTANSLFSAPRINNHWADFYKIHIFYALHIRNPTYQIWKKSVQ